MKSVFLTTACLAIGAAALSAQSYVPPVGSVAPGNPAQNPDFRTLPVVESGLPSMNLPGMSTTYADAPTGSLVEGFGTDYSSSSSSSSSSYSSSSSQETIYSSANRASQPVSGSSSDADGSGDSKWIDRDNDGYDPVIDEVEQGAETAVKATGQALDEVGSEVKEFVTGEEDDPNEVDRDGNFITRGVKSAARNTKKVARGTVKTTGKAVRGTAKTTGKVVKGTAKTTGKVARGTAKTTGKAVKGTAKTTGKVVRGTGKAVTRPFRGSDQDASDMNTQDADMDFIPDADNTVAPTDSDANMMPSMGTGGEVKPDGQ